MVTLSTKVPRPYNSLFSSDVISSLPILETVRRMAIQFLFAFHFIDCDYKNNFTFHLVE